MFNGNGRQTDRREREKEREWERKEREIDSIRYEKSDVQNEHDSLHSLNTLSRKSV